MSERSAEVATRSVVSLVSIRWLSLLPLAASVLPPLLVGVSIVGGGARFPIEDHWDTVAMLERDASRTLTFSDLWAQQNEHRYVIPWLLIIGLARLTGWDIRAELWANVVVSVLTLAVVAWLILRIDWRKARPVASWLVLAASLAIFSIVKWENWLWSGSQPAFLNVLMTVVTVAAYALRGATPVGTALTILGAVAATLCFANGLLLLALIPAALGLDPRMTRKHRLLAAAAAGVVGIVMALAYLAGFSQPAKHPAAAAFLTNPAGFIAYVLAFLGAPLGWPSLAWSVVWGAGGLIGLVVAAARLWRDRATRTEALPWLLLASYVLLSAAMASVARLGFGLGQALSSRYTTFSCFFWIAVAVVLALEVRRLLDGTWSRRRQTVAVAAAAMALLAAAASYVSVSTHAGRMVEHLETVHARGLECVRFHRQAPDACLRISHHDTGLVRDRGARVERLGLGPFRGHDTRRDVASYTRVDTERPGGWIDAVWFRPVALSLLTGGEYRDTEVWVFGWAMDPMTRGTVATVLIVVDGVVVDRVPTGLSRADVANAEGASLARAGWSSRFLAFRLPPHPRTLEAWAVLDDGRIARLAGGRQITTKP